MKNNKIKLIFTLTMILVYLHPFYSYSENDTVDIKSILEKKEYSEKNIFDLKSVMEDESYLLNAGDEKGIEKSEGDYENLSNKLKKHLVKEFNIEGQWDSYYHHDGVHLFIAKSRNNLFNIYFHASGDIWSWSYKRTATFKNGVLELNKLVKEYAPYKPYKHFYLLKTPYGIRFVSQPRVRRYLKEDDWSNIDNLLYKVKS